MKLIAADKLVKRVLGLGAEYNGEMIDTTAVVEAINNAPTVDAEPVKHGYWIETIEGTFCSNCNRNPIVMGEFQIANYSANYCPHCGAKMDKNGG